MTSANNDAVNRHLHGKHWADSTRNERQKSFLLYEVARLRRGQSSELIHRCDELIRQTKYLCARTEALLRESKQRIHR
jgi:hypothetical protein